MSGGPGQDEATGGKCRNRRHCRIALQKSAQTPIMKGKHSHTVNDSADCICRVKQTWCHIAVILSPLRLAEE